MALLLTLGVLSLLLVLGLSFVFTARTDRAAAVVYSDLTKAKLMADSGLNRAVAALAYNHRAGAVSANVYPATKPAGDHGDGLFAKIDNQYIFVSSGSGDTAGLNDALIPNIPFAYFQYDFEDDPDTINASWNHIEDEDGDIIGRLAFLVVDESGKLDPAAITDNADAASLYNWTGIGTPPFNEGDEERWGYSPSEINLLHAYPSGVTDTDVPPDDFRTELTASNWWLSWRYMKNVIGISNNDAQTLAQSLFPYSYDTERFRPSSGGTASRLNVAQTAVGSVGSIRNRVKWLSSMEDDSGNSLTSQVEANIIDYCDNDDYATTDYDVANRTASYCGVEEVPYINEVGFFVKYSPPDPTPNTNPTPRKLSITVHPELVNIYGDNYTDALTVEVQFDININGLSSPPSTTTPNHADSADDSGDTDPATFSATFSWTPGDIGTVNDRSYKDIGGKIITYKWSTDEDPTIEITGITVIVYHDDDGDPTTPIPTDYIHDVANIDTTASGSQLVELVSFDPGTGTVYNPNYYSISIEAKDPRSNTLDRNWAWEGSWTTGGGGISVGTLGAPNNAWDHDVTSSGGYDVEDEVDADTDPTVGLSTAYIRNEGMKSLWELGAIHRGEPWRTINLTAYDDGSDPASGSGTYANGDAAILGQVKLDSQATTTGKVNVNSPVEEVYNALFQGIKLGGTYDDPHGATGATDITNITDLRDDILDQNGWADPDPPDPYDPDTDPASGGSAFLQRGQIAQATTLTDGTAGSQDNNREQEEIIGKLANLLTVRQNYFRIIVVGQAVKDLGDVPDAMDADDRESGWVEYDSGNGLWCSVLAEQKIMAIVYRDAITNKFKVERFEYLED